MLHLRCVLTGRRMNSQNSDPWQSICQSLPAQRLPCKLMSSLRLPLLSSAYFSISAACGWKARAGLQPRGSCQAGSASKHFTFHSYLRANMRADRQANTCALQHNWKGERLRSARHPRGVSAWQSFIIIIVIIIIKAEFHSLVCSAACSCQPCVRRPLCAHRARVCEAVSFWTFCVWLAHSRRRHLGWRYQ